MSFVGTVLWGYAALFSSTSQCPVFELLTETIGACVQEERLWRRHRIDYRETQLSYRKSDPKALNHILQKSGYLYTKPNDLQELSALIANRGITTVGGELSTTTNPFFHLV